MAGVTMCLTVTGGICMGSHRNGDRCAGHDGGLPHAMLTFRRAHEAAEGAVSGRWGYHRYHSTQSLHCEHRPSRWHHSRGRVVSGLRARRTTRRTRLNCAVSSAAPAAPYQAAPAQLSQPTTSDKRLTSGCAAKLNSSSCLLQPIFY